MSLDEIRTKYNALMEDVRTNPFYENKLVNRVNCYQCRCGHTTKTRDADSGVTPFLFECEKCGGDGVSTFYKDTVPKQEPTFEWYRPDLEECFKNAKNEGYLEHVFLGGLIVRKL